VLAEAGVVTRRAQGPRRLYSVRPETMRDISEWTMSHREFWAGSLDRLTAALLMGDPSE
jgi:hypothetical protein